jgi:hypothetical protein
MSLRPKRNVHAFDCMTFPPHVLNITYSDSVRYPWPVLPTAGGRSPGILCMGWWHQLPYAGRRRAKALGRPLGLRLQRGSPPGRDCADCRPAPVHAPFTGQVRVYSVVRLSMVHFLAVTSFC